MNNTDNQQKNLPRLSRNVIILGLVSLCNDVSSEMIYPLLPVFLTISLGASAQMLGVIEGIAESTAAILKLFSGWLSDRMGRRKKIIVGGYSLSALTRPLVAIAASGWHVLLIRFGDRTGKGIRSAPRDALIADSIDPKIRGKAFGFHRAMDHTGAIIGPLLAMLLLSWSANNYRLVFWIASIPAFLGVLLLILGIKESAVSHRRKQSMPNIKSYSTKFYTYLVTIIIFTLGNSSDAFLLLRAKDLGVPVSLIPVLWLMLHIVKMVSSIPGGSLSDRVNRKWVVISGWIVYAMVYAGFAIASAMWHIWALFGIYGLYFGLTESTERAFVADFVKPEQRGTAYGIFNLAIGIAALPSSVIMGVLWHRYNPTIAFGFGALLALLASLMLITIRCPSENTYS